MPPKGIVATAYDTIRKKLLALIPGTKPAPTKLYEYDGKNFVLISSVVDSALASVRAIAFDSKRRVLVAEAKGLLHEWDGTKWSKNVVGSFGNRPGLAYDSNRGVVIGAGFTSLFLFVAHEWDGKTHRTVVTPLRYFRSQQVVYDSVRKLTVLVGRFISPPHTVEWDGTKALIAQLTGPAFSGTMAFDLRRNKTIIHETKGGTWEFDGKAWAKVPFLKNSPPNGLMAYDPSRDKVVLITDNEVWELGAPSTPPALWADKNTLSVTTGGAVNFQINAGTKHHGKLYFLLGSMSGNWPGIKLGSLVLPLNFDPYFSYTLDDPGGLIVRSLGVLIGGKATAVLNIPPRMGIGLDGRTLHHAYVVFPLSALSFDFTSNAVPLLLAK